MTVPVIEGFRSVLAQGEGQTTLASDLAANQLDGRVPKRFTHRPQTEPAGCDQIVPTTAGAIDTPPFPWQNRGTYHQVAKLRARR